MKFPVLVNGQRVELNAIHATGPMTLGGTTRPFEHIILAQPQYPISLRIAYGPRGGGFPFKADFAREIVRRPGNPLLRYVGGAALQATDEPSILPTATQETLPL